MRFAQIETLPAGKAIVNIDTLTHAVSEGGGGRLFLGTHCIDVSHSLTEQKMSRRVVTGPTMAQTAEPGSVAVRPVGWYTPSIIEAV